MIDLILANASKLERKIQLVKPMTEFEVDNVHKIRWIILAGSPYEKEVQNFTKMMNQLNKENNLRLELIKSTGFSIRQLLFNNYDKHQQRGVNGNGNLTNNQIS